MLNLSANSFALHYPNVLFFTGRIFCGGGGRTHCSSSSSSYSQISMTQKESTNVTPISPEVIVSPFGVMVCLTLHSPTTPKATVDSSPTNSCRRDPVLSGHNNKLSSGHDVNFHEHFNKILHDKSSILSIQINLIGGRPTPAVSWRMD